MKSWMLNQTKPGRNILVVALVTLLLLAACASAPSVPKGQEKVVELGLLASLTGGAASADQGGFNGIMDYVRYFNEEEGIPGVTIEIVWRDTATDVVKFMSLYRMLVDRGVPLLFSNSSGLEGGKSHFEKDQMPVVTGASAGSLVYPTGWVYCAWATQGEIATAVFDHFMQNWEEESPPKLQYFIIDNPWGWSAEAEGTKYAQRIGFDVLPVEVGSPVIIDATTQLLRIQQHEADLVWLQMLVQGAGPVMRDAERMGLQDKMQFAGTEWIMGEPLINMAPSSVESFLSPKCLPWLDEMQIPGINTMTEIQLKYHGEVYRGPEYIAGWVYGPILCEAIKRALEEVGYENLDGPAVKRALESMKDFDVDGMTKITFGPEIRRGSRSCALYQVQNGKIVRVSDWHEVPILVPWE
jgi:ABC-type branched-subunit amino acid transport system substrate-binding protein